MKSSLLTCLSLLLATLSICMLGACSDVAVEQAAEGFGGNAGGKYIQISVTANGLQTPYGSRSSRSMRKSTTPTPPNGGEDGDGTETGFGNEFDVKRVSVLLYKEPDNVTIPSNGLINISREEAEKIPVWVRCFNTMRDVHVTGTGTENIVYTTGAQELPKEFTKGKYRILVVANKELVYLDGHSLADLRDYVYSYEPFDYGKNADGTTNYEDLSKCSNFAMASVHEQQIVIGDDITGHQGEGTESNPYVPIGGNIELERLAARIDFAQKEEAGKCTWNETDSCYDYAVIDPTTQKQVATFKLTHIFPFNITKQGYVFKHTTTLTDTTTCNYLGRETETTQKDGAWIKHYASNYVLDPKTLVKGKANAVFGQYFITELRQNVLANYAKILWERCKVKSPTQMHHETEGNKRFNILCYTAENTLTIDAQNPKDSPMEHYTAGLRFYGRYVKKGDDPSTAPYIALDWFLRHSAPDGKVDLNLPMSYGVVRNNIYRVFIQSISAQEEQLELKTQVSVVPWAQYTHTEIVM